LCNDPTHIEENLKKIIAYLWKEHQQQQIRSSLEELPCKIFSKKKAKTAPVHLKLNSYENTIYVMKEASNNDKEILFELPSDTITNWVFGINLENTNQNLVIYSSRKIMDQRDTPDYGFLDKLFNGSDSE